MGADSLLNTNAAYVIVNNKTLTATAARLDGHEISGDGKTEITALHNTLGAVLSSITTDDVTIPLTAATVLNLNARLPLPEDKSAVVISGSFRLTLHDDNIVAYGDLSHTRLSISSGTTLKASAALLTGKTVSGDGKAEITALHSTLGAVLSSITTDDVEIILSAATVLNSSARLPIPEDDTAVVISGSYKLTLDDNNIGSNTNGLSISSGTTLSGTAARLTGKTVSGAGTTEITTLNGTTAANLLNINTNTVNIPVDQTFTFNGRLPQSRASKTITVTISGSNTLTLEGASSTTHSILSSLTNDGITFSGTANDKVIINMNNANDSLRSSDFSKATFTTLKSDLKISTNNTFIGTFGDDFGQNSDHTITINGAATLTATAAKLSGLIIGGNHANNIINITNLGDKLDADFSKIAISLGRLDVTFNESTTDPFTGSFKADAATINLNVGAGKTLNINENNVHEFVSYTDSSNALSDKYVNKLGTGLLILKKSYTSK